MLAVFAGGAATAQWTGSAAPGESEAAAPPASAPVVHSGTQYLVKNNAALFGCFQATMSACQQVFGACERSGNLIIYRSEGASMAAICGEITVLEGDGVVMSVGYGAVEEAFEELREEVGEMVRLSQETYW